VGIDGTLNRAGGETPAANEKMWFKHKTRNRRTARAQDVLDVKLRSSRLRAGRTRLASIALAVCFGTILGLYCLWQAGEWALDRLIYDNKSFAIQQIDVVTDGVISADQLRRWSGVKTGDNLLALDLAGVKRNLELVPMIESASVERILPGTLRIQITEREPAAQARVPRPRAGGGLDLMVFEIDSEGCVMFPLDPRQRSVPLAPGEDQLPVISGLNVCELQPGRRIESAQARAALQLIASFESSPMAGLVELKRIDVSEPEVLVVTTGQGSEITFGPENFDRQLPRWQAVHELGLKMNKVIATLDLAVPNNVPARWLEASARAPPPPKTAKPLRSRKKNV
jgi:cell division septal protein FtsQ